MNVSEITTDDLKRIIVEPEWIQLGQIYALAQAELSRREKVEIVKSCGNCGNGPFASDKILCADCSPETANNWTPNPTERAEIEPSQAVMNAIQMESIEQRLHNLALSFNGLLERMDAIEKPTERAEVEPWLCLPSEALTRNEVDAVFQQLQRRLEMRKQK
jgi:hypothetical protein